MCNTNYIVHIVLRTSKSIKVFCLVATHNEKNVVTKTGFERHVDLTQTDKSLKCEKSSSSLIPIYYTPMIILK